MLPPVSKFQCRLSRARLSKTLGVGGGGLNKVYYRQFQEMGVRVAEQIFFSYFYYFINDFYIFSLEDSLTFLTSKLFKHCILLLIY